MPSIAGLPPKGAFPFSFRTLVLAAASSPGASGGDALAARALAATGFVSVLGLPILLLASLALDAPLAVPAAIASGYLAIAHALRSNRPRRAGLMGVGVLSALVGWLVFYLAGGDAPLSPVGMTAALLAPIFAAAPAFARSLMAPRATGVESEASSRTSALQRVAFLDELTPKDVVLIADGEGCVLAATRAARECLQLLPDAFEHSLAGLFEPADMASVADALRRCRTRGGAITVALDGDGMKAGRTGGAWIFTPCDGGAVSLRAVESLPARNPTYAAPVVRKAATVLPVEEPSIVAPVACDIGEAIAFALRRAQPRASKREITMTGGADAGIFVACDRQVARRIVHLAIDAAFAANRGGATIHIDARKLKGIVLLRIASDTTMDMEREASASIELSPLRTLVDDAGGTLMVEHAANRLMLSVRLGLAAVAVANGQAEERAKAA